MLAMKSKKPKDNVPESSNVDQQLYQAGWRVDKRDMHIFEGISKWAEENRYSRNMAITIAVEFFLKAQAEKSDQKKP